ATLDLAWVAAGRLDAYWERDLSPWDMAAGIILVREAGGFVTDLDGAEAIFAKGQIVAGNDTMHKELLRLLREAGKAAADCLRRLPGGPTSMGRSGDAGSRKSDAAAGRLAFWFRPSYAILGR